LTTAARRCDGSLLTSHVPKPELTQQRVAQGAS
jgi:hypothetical protein